MGAYVTPKQIERLVNPFLKNFLSDGADSIAKIGLRELHELTGLARYQVGQISRREMLDAGTIIQNFELTDNVPQGAMVELDLNNNTSKYFTGDVIDLTGVRVPTHSPSPGDYEPGQDMLNRGDFKGDYMWQVSERHIMMGMNDICDTYHGKIYTLETAPKKPHQHCRCKLIPINDYKSKVGTEKTLNADREVWKNEAQQMAGGISGPMSDVMGDVASVALVSALGLTGPAGSS